MVYELINKSFGHFFVFCLFSTFCFIFIINLVESIIKYLTIIIRGYDPNKTTKEKTLKEEDMNVSKEKE